MFKRSQRVTVEDFEELMKKGRVFHSPLFSVRYMRGEVGTLGKYTVVVSKKTAGKAVLRNRIKRRVRSAMKLVLPQSTPPCLMAVFVKKDIQSLLFNDLKQELQIAFRNIGIL